MVYYDLLCIFYVGDRCIYMTDRKELSDLEEVEILRTENQVSVGESVRRGFEEHPGQLSRGLRFAGSRLFMADPYRPDNHYADNRNSDHLINWSLNVKATAGELKAVSIRHFGRARKPLVVLQISYVEC